MAPAEALARALREEIGHERALAAVAAIPRELFVAPGVRERAYANEALPIACEQTISQPLVVARMLELLALEPTDRVLDVGTGSGYHAALLGHLAAHVWSIERHPALARAARRSLTEAGAGNVTVIAGDGRAGHPAGAPYDAVNVAAAAVQLPVALLDQLAPGGRLVAPVGAEEQRLVRVRRTTRGLSRERFEPVRFLPLVGG